MQVDAGRTTHRMKASAGNQESFDEAVPLIAPPAFQVGSVFGRLVAVPMEAMGRMSATTANTRASLVADITTPIALSAAAFARHTVHALPAFLTVSIGLLLFTLVEYVFHRWIFHGTRSLKEFEEGHARHHRDPLGDDALPFFLPPAILLILAGLFWVVVPAGYALLLAASIGFGYASYGLGHFVIHNVRFRNPIGRSWAARHHIHHHHPDRNFGVTTPLWDIVLGTRYVSKRVRPRAS